MIINHNNMTYNWANGWKFMKPMLYSFDLNFYIGGGGVQGDVKYVDGRSLTLPSGPGTTEITNIFNHDPSVRARVTMTKNEIKYMIERFILNFYNEILSGISNNLFKLKLNSVMVDDVTVPSPKFNNGIRPNAISCYRILPQSDENTDSPSQITLNGGLVGGLSFAPSSTISPAWPLDGTLAGLSQELMHNFGLLHEENMNTASAPNGFGGGFIKRTQSLPIQINPPRRLDFINAMSSLYQSTKMTSMILSGMYDNSIVTT